MEIQNTSLEVLRECKYNKYDIGMVSDNDENSVLGKIMREHDSI